jgi:hypothetical protein
MRPLARIAAAATLVAIVLIASGAVAFAQGYDMSLTLPTYGKSGCMVCHGDSNLVRMQGGRLVSFYISDKALAGSAHAKVLCTGCHIDFAYKAPHDSRRDWRTIAKTSCKNCHKTEWEAYSKSVHGPTAQPGASNKAAAPDKKPLCGDCHDGHTTKSFKDPAYKATYHARAADICGRCHKDYWANYADYYHGSAYRKGAPDAPACWDCHGSHEMEPSSVRTSSVYKDNLVETCSKCHKGVGEQYTEYATVIHRKQAAFDANPVYAWVRDASGAFGGWFDTVKSWFSRPSGGA